MIIKIKIQNTKYPPCGICKKKSHLEKDCWFRGKPQCRNCKKFGLVEKVCRLKQNHQANFSEEKEEGWTDEQFIYKLRKKAIGPNKKALWLMPEDEKNNIRAKLAEELEILFQKLNIVGTSHTVKKYIESGN